MSTLTFRISEKLKEGLRGKDVAALLGCDRSYVSMVKTGKQATRVSWKKRIQIAYLWGSGECATKIGKSLGLSTEQTLRVLREEDLI